MDAKFEKLLVQIVDRLPRIALSRAFGAISEWELPSPLQMLVNEAFATAAGIDRAESEKPPRAYDLLNALFTRKLKEDARSIESREEGAFVSPVDGTLTRFGTIDGETLFTVKGETYGITELIGDPGEAERFVDGAFAVLYLSPRDYHRIHSPTRAAVQRLRLMPGDLFPVNPIWLGHKPDLFSMNERIVSLCETPGGDAFSLISIGATCVGRITISFNDLKTSEHDRPRRDVELDPSPQLEHGDEFGVFNLGSTVVLLFEEPNFEFASSLSAGQSIKMGQCLGRL
jgi:phosphatidylserine decarboxylase